MKTKKQPIDIGQFKNTHIEHQRLNNRIVVLTIGKYPLSSVINEFNRGQPTRDGVCYNFRSDEVLLLHLSLFILLFKYN